MIKYGNDYQITTVHFKSSKAFWKYQLERFDNFTGESMSQSYPCIYSIYVVFQLTWEFHCQMLVIPEVSMIPARWDHYCRYRWFREMFLVLCMHHTVMTLQRPVRSQLVWILWHVGAFHWPLCSHLTDSLIFFQDGLLVSKFRTQKNNKK